MSEMKSLAELLLDVLDIRDTSGRLHDFTEHRRRTMEAAQDFVDALLNARNPTDGPAETDE